MQDIALFHICPLMLITAKSIILSFLFTLLGETGTGWMMNRSPEGFKFFYNVITGDYAWVRNDSIIKDYSILTKEEIQVYMSFALIFLLPFSILM